MLTCYQLDTREPQTRKKIATFQLTREVVQIDYDKPKYASIYSDTFSSLHGLDEGRPVYVADGQAYLDALPEQGWTFLDFVDE